MRFRLEARLRRAMLAAALCLPLVAGCQSPMPYSKQSNSDYVAPRPEVTWPFDGHSFGAYCYNTIGCKVLYANRYHAGYYIRKSDNDVAPPPETPGVQKYWHGGHIGLANFPPPAIVTWRSLDGASHEAHVDIGQIFEDQLVLHNVPADKLAWNATKTGADPDIILVVNDRTISVYMKSFVPLKAPRVPGNPHSDYQDEAVLAWRRTY